MVIASIFGAKILGRRKLEEDSSIPKKAKIVSYLYFVIVLLSYVYSILLPLEMDTIWFSIGVVIYVPFIIFLFVGLWNFNKTPTDELVTNGVYGVSRNPSYVSAVLLNLSIGIACLSWVFILIAVVDYVLLNYYVAVVEEPFLLSSYGDTYRKYMNTTPRWIGIPKQLETK
jgi:protein-S-isoprenylcysteine O-methyltransferase Ste14